MDKFKGNTVVIGTVNPKGLPDGTKTTYFTESQVQKAAKRFRDRRKRPIPLYIDHKTKDDKGRPVKPCGFVWFGKVREDNGKLYAVAVLYDDDNGKLANDLVKHKTCPMREFSLGYNILMEDKNGSLDVTDLEVTELSLCYKGVQPTDLSIITTVDEIVNAGMPKNNTNQKNINNKNINLNKQTSDNPTNQTSVPQKGKKRDRDQMSASGNGDMGYNPYNWNDGFYQTYNSRQEYEQRENVKGYDPAQQRDFLLSRFSDEISRSYQPQQYTMSATAAAGDMDTDTPQTQTGNSNINQTIDQLLNEYNQQLKNGTAPNTELEETIRNLKKYSVGQGKSELSQGLNAPAPSMNDVKRGLLDRWERVKSVRKRTVEECKDADDWQREQQLYALQDEKFERELKEIEERMNKMNTTIQTKFRSILPALLKVNEQSGNNLQPQDVQEVEKFFSNAAAVDNKTADSLVKFIEASASFATENTGYSHKAADSINDLFQRYKSTETLKDEQHNLIEQMKKEMEILKKENQALKNSAIKPIQPTIGNSVHIPRDTNIKRMKVATQASQGGQDSAIPWMQQGRQIMPTDRLSDYGKAALTASIKCSPKEDAESHYQRASIWDDMMSNPEVKRHDIGEYHSKLFEKLGGARILPPGSGFEQGKPYYGPDWSGIREQN